MGTEGTRLSNMAWPVLTFDGGPQDGTSIPIEQPVLKIGRDADRDVVVKGPGVSRDHAEIVLTDAGFYIRDRASTNGTFVNGLNIGTSRHFLAPGDEIRLGSGKVTLVFRQDDRKTVAMPAMEFLAGEVPDLGAPSAKEPPGKPHEDQGTLEYLIVQYLLGHPAGADFKTLQEIAGESRYQLRAVLGSLMDQHMVRSDYPLFFAATRLR